MSYYCEACHAVSAQNGCRFCGKAGLRTPRAEDYCFLAEVGDMFGPMIMGIFDEEQIAYAATPSGNGVRSQFALRLGNLKIFVTYECFNQAEEILNSLNANYEESQRKGLTDHMDKLFILPRNEKKIKKQLRLNEDGSVIAYCADIILHADSVVNKGRISGCTKGGEYLCVYKGDELVMVNSVTHEIISVVRTNARGK